MHASRNGPLKSNREQIRSCHVNVAEVNLIVQPLAGIVTSVNALLTLFSLIQTDISASSFHYSVTRDVSTAIFSLLVELVWFLSLSSFFFLFSFFILDLYSTDGLKLDERERKRENFEIPLGNVLLLRVG